VALAFEQAVVEVLVEKTVGAVRRHGAASIVLTGGVSANRRLRRALQLAAPVPVHMPALRHCRDNGSMIAVAGAWRLARGQVARGPIDIAPGLRLAG